MKQLTDLNDLVSARQRKLDAEYAASKQKQAELAAAAELEAAKLQPAADAVAALRTKLNGLSAKRDELLEKLRVGKIQLAQQESFAAEFDELARQIVGHSHDGRPSPHDFLTHFGVKPYLPFAAMLVEKIKPLLAEYQAELESVEAEIGELARAK